MGLAFEKFEEIDKLEDILKKQREWLKYYEGKHYSIAYEEKHRLKWATERRFYHDSSWNSEINCIGRLGNRTIIEFDGQSHEEIKKAKAAFVEVKEKLKNNKWGFIESTHSSTKTNYLWIEFKRDMKDKEVEAFLAWICPNDAIIDLNFASSKKVFAVLYATHWKHSYYRELPIEYFKGEQIDFDSLGIPITKKIKKITTNKDGFLYTTFQAAKIFNKKTQAEQFEKIQPLFYDKNGLWWLWSDNLYKWEIVDEVDILNMIENATGQDIITPKERTLILNSLKQEGRKHIPEPIKNTWIQFRDEICDISSGERFKSTSKYFSTNPIPYNLNKYNMELTPTMDKIFEEWVGKDYVKILYEIIAYCMLPNYPIHRLFCFIGAGMNGKSCYLRLLKKFIGEENTTATELDTLLTSRFEVTRLYKKLVCIMGETNFNEMSKTSIIKKLTGQDDIGFEYKNKNPFNDVNYAKILIATNNLPTTTDKTIGFYRRWTIIDFPNQFSEAKDILSDIPEEEYSSLALKCCSILKDLLNRRSFTNEGSLEDRQKKYEDKSDPLQKFIKLFIKEDLSGHIWKYDFEKKFNSWCKENRHREFSDVMIGRKMKELNIEQQSKTATWLNDGQGGLLRAWVGIRWLS